MKKIKSDDLLSIAVLFQIITSIVQLLLPLIGFMEVEQAAKMRIAVTVVTFLPAILSLLRHHTKGVILVFSLYFAVLLINFLLFPASNKFIKSTQAWTLTPIALLTALCMYNIRDYERFWKLLLYASRLCSVLAVPYFLAFTFSPLRATDEAYSMHFGYSLLLPIMYLFTRPGFIDKILSVVMLVIVLLIGSRGSAGMAIFFYGIYLVAYNRKSILKLAVPMLIIVPVLITYLPKFYDMESSRTMALIMSGEVGTHDSGRGDIYKVVERKINEQPLTGWGIGADREFWDTYAHNLVLELSLHYGVVITAIIILFLLFYLIRGLNPKRAKKIGGWIFVAMMALYGLLPLMFSNSYLVDYKFATFAGVLFSVFRKGYHTISYQIK